MLKRAIKKILFRLGYTISRNDDLDAFYPLLHYHLARSRSLFIVQVGAHDGTMMDPLYDFIREHRESIQGVAIEPLKDIFDRLVKTYADFPRIKLVNVAIHTTERVMEMWRIAPQHEKKVAPWARGMASFDRNHHSHHNIPSEYIISEKVRCLSFQELMEAYAINKIDLLQIDTEGYDAEILMSFNFERIKPVLIHFEHGFHEGFMSIDRFNTLADHLHEHGYELSIGLHDATAYLRTLFVEA